MKNPRPYFLTSNTNVLILNNVYKNKPIATRWRYIIRICSYTIILHSKMSATGMNKTKLDILVCILCKCNCSLFLRIAYKCIDYINRTMTALGKKTIRQKTLHIKSKEYVNHILLCILYMYISFKQIEKLL